TGRRLGGRRALSDYLTVERLSYDRSATAVCRYTTNVTENGFTVTVSGELIWQRRMVFNLPIHEVGGGGNESQASFALPKRSQGVCHAPLRIAVERDGDGRRGFRPDFRKPGCLSSLGGLAGWIVSLVRRDSGDDWRAGISPAFPPQESWGTGRSTGATGARINDAEVQNVAMPSGGSSARDSIDGRFYLVSQFKLGGLEND